MHKIIFEHLNEDVISIRKEKSIHGHLYRFFKDARKQLEQFVLTEFFKL